MATLKICTLKRTHWITDVQEVVLASTFLVKHFDDPFRDAMAANTASASGSRVVTVMDFQAPCLAEKVVGDITGNVLYIRRANDTSDFRHTVIAPQRSCFLMSDVGKTIDRF